MIELRFVTVTLVAVSTLAACSSPEDPFTPSCKQFTEHLLNRVDGLDWKNASTESGIDNDLVVNLNYVVKGSDEPLTSSCAFEAEPDESDFGDMSGHSHSPYRVTLNGVDVNDVDMIKMSASLFGKEAKATMDAAVKGAQEMGGEAVGKARSAIGEAAGELQDAMNK